MMERYSGDFLAAVDGLRALLGCTRPRVAGQGGRRDASARSTGTDRLRAARWKSTRDSRAATVQRVWLEPPPVIHPAVGGGDPALRRGDHRAGELLHEPHAAAAGATASEALAEVRGPVILIANLLTEGAA